ncbi:MAG: hypothetical protein AB2A00_02660 [Myxococcota bacterium]
MFVIEFPRRGKVTWKDGAITVESTPEDVPHDLEEAVRAVLEMEDVDLTVPSQVRHALLSMAGAQLVVDTSSHDGHGGNGRDSR